MALNALVYAGIRITLSYQPSLGVYIGTFLSYLVDGMASLCLTLYLALVQYVFPKD